MAYGDFKDLPTRAAPDKLFRDKAFNVVKNPKYDDYQRRLSSMVYKCFHKKTSGATTSGGAVKSEIMSNQELALENLNHEKYNHFL